MLSRVLDTITPAEYAEGVVRMAVKKPPPAWFWHGAQTSSVRLLDALFPYTVWVCTFHSGCYS